MSRSLWFAYCGCGCGDPAAHLERAADGAAELAGSVVPDPSVTLEEPVSVDEAKKHCRIDLNNEDDLVAIYIAAARDYCEQHCERAFATQGFLAMYGVIDSQLPLDLRPCPVSAVSKVVEIPADGSAEVELTGYRLDAITSLLYPPPAGWPLLPSQLRVAYTAGAADVLPPAVREAILLLVALYFDHRHATADSGSPVEIPRGVGDLLHGSRLSTGVVSE